jgi:carbonic anhydrase
VGIIDEVLSASHAYARNFSRGDLRAPPRRRLAVVACMDARITVEELLGLQAGDAHVIRNAGGIVTDDVLRSLIISHHLLGTREVMIIEHTDCGMLTFADGELRSRLERETGVAADEPARFHAFSDLERNLHAQIARVRAHPWIADDVPVRGFVYDVRSGALREVAG